MTPLMLLLLALFALTAAVLAIQASGLFATDPTHQVRAQIKRDICRVLRRQGALYTGELQQVVVGRPHPEFTEALDELAREGRVSRKAQLTLDDALASDALIRLRR